MKIVKFQSDDLLFLITDLERSRKSTITNCFSFFDISIRSVSNLNSNTVKVGKFKEKLTYPAFPTSEAFPIKIRKKQKRFDILFFKDLSEYDLKN